MNIEIKAPVKGNVVAIESAPDIVFAEKMMGNGIAIEPLDNKVYAPITGVFNNRIPNRSRVWNKRRK